MKIQFNLEVTVNSYDDKRHDVTVQAKDADEITRHIVSKAFDFSTLSEAIKFTVDEAISTVSRLAAQEKEQKFEG